MAGWPATPPSRSREHPPQVVALGHGGDADDGPDSMKLVDLDVGQADVGDQSLLAELGETGWRARHSVPPGRVGG